ncbi:hypothetical protein [Sphingomonas aracearum]|uniref:Transmembrane protein n=1 Tax=Sphingomonas aracearum TaxID=2283317 RepID=A0A369VX26_9SPHN|nr:hypothetical protein [Sphingomonas aracearum]RDE06936.1 hypothetical protein DVW87_04505 [Sphingomonas aracearum]
MPTHFTPRSAASGHPFRHRLGKRGHPFRRTVRGGGHPMRRLLKNKRGGVSLSTRDEDQDLKLFVLSFTAFFICFATFIF